MKEDDAAAIWGDAAAAADDDFSPSATIVPFDPPRPLLRVPVPAAPSDNPSDGPFVLAFPDARSWRSAFRVTESKIIDQCEAGARAGCSITASNKCRLPWWKSIFGATAADYAEREQCEELEMASCFATSKVACRQFAKEKCLPPFRDARIALIDSKAFAHLVFNTANENDSEVELSDSSLSLQQESMLGSLENSGETTTCRGHLLLEKSSVENTVIR